MNVHRKISYRANQQRNVIITIAASNKEFVNFTFLIINRALIVQKWVFLCSIFWCTSKHIKRIIIQENRFLFNEIITLKKTARAKFASNKTIMNLKRFPDLYLNLFPIFIKLLVQKLLASLKLIIFVLWTCTNNSILTKPDRSVLGSLIGLLILLSCRGLSITDFDLTANRLLRSGN